MAGSGADEQMTFGDSEPACIAIDFALPEHLARFGVEADDLIFATDDKGSTGMNERGLMRRWPAPLDADVLHLGELGLVGGELVLLRLIVGTQRLILLRSGG